MNQFDKENSVFKYILEHKKVVKRSLVLFVITFVLALIFSSDVISFFEAISPLNLNFIQTNPSEIFVLFLKVAFLFAFIAVFPIITYHFVKPTFRKNNDKRNFILILLGGLFLFFVGIMFACWITIPVLLYFFIGLNLDLARLNINITSYTSFCILTALFSGLLFLLPVIRYVLIKMRLLDTKFLSNNWKYAAVVAIGLPIIIVSNEIFEILFYSATFLIFYGLIIFIAKIY